MLCLTTAYTDTFKTFDIQDNSYLLLGPFSLGQTIERVFNKLAVSLTQRVDDMIDQRLQQQSADQNLITLVLEKENQLLCSKVDDLEIKYDT